jgi:hypothetical protein
MNDRYQANGMNRVTATRKNVFFLLLAALALRAVIPIGYMPGSLGGELLLELCPDGMPTAMVQALGGEQHHHHGGDKDQTTDASLDQCQMGHMLTSVALSSNADIALEPTHTPVLANFTGIVAGTARSVVYQSRAPPVIA